MHRIIRFSICIALTAGLLPLLAAAETAPASPASEPVADEPSSGENAPELSLEELEKLLGIPAPEPMVCTQSNNCIHCTIPTFRCTCLCDVEMDACMDACGSNYNCIDQCEFDGQDCHEECYGSN